jgi:hypothetical protein
VAPPAPHTIWPDIPADLEALLLAMLAKDPRDRPSLLTVSSSLEALGGRVPPRTSSMLAPVAVGADVVDTWDMAPRHDAAAG